MLLEDNRDTKQIDQKLDKSTPSQFKIKTKSEIDLDLETPGQVQKQFN